MPGVRITNEIGTLTRAIVHKPGAEAHDYATSSFEQVFYLRAAHGKRSFEYERAIEEYDRLMATLRREGVELLELDMLLEEAIDSVPDARTRFIDEFVGECGAAGEELSCAVRSYLQSAPTTAELVRRSISGIHYGEVNLDGRGAGPLTAQLGADYDAQALLAGPLNTMFFTRDPVAVVGEGVALCHMLWTDRAREGLLYRTVFTHHPAFAGTPFWYSNTSSYHIEGGDIINLGNGSIALGISERTEPAAIDILASRLLWAEASGIDTVYAVRVPSHGKQLHFDTYLTRIDHAKFLIDSLILQDFAAWRIERGERPGATRVSDEPSLHGLLSRALGYESVSLIPCGNEGSMAAVRESENNASSVLCLSPGRLCVCAGNPVTCEMLSNAGIELVTVDIAELSYGYGGPGCLCLPIWREG